MDSKQIIDVIKEALDDHKDFRRTKTLVNTVYNILCAIYLEDKKHIILEAPTGTGKTVIAYMVNFCMQKIEENKFQSYLLTSSKILQDQIEADKEKFNFNDNTLAILKGTSNYACLPIKPESYKNRYCKGMSADAISLLSCYQNCPYLVARSKAVSAQIAVMNYAYYLTTIQNSYGNFTGRRLTISDECHLLPTIVNDLFNFDLNGYRICLSKIIDLLNGFKMSFGNSQSANELIQICNNHLRLFLRSKITFDDFKTFIYDFIEVSKKYNEFLSKLKEYCNSNNILNHLNLFKKDMDYIYDSFEKLINVDFIDNYIKSLLERPEDILVESIKQEKSEFYNHIVRDLDETNAVRRYFIKHVDIGIYMSATIGNVDDYAVMLGLGEDEYKAYRLASDFDFSKSPIYLVNSGYLDYRNFQDNIDNVIVDTLKICKLHSNEKGIIHTATFDITEKLRNRLSLVKDKEFVERFLFYSTPEEKNIAVEKIKSDDGKNYIIVGPSLYEGLSLDNDNGRFNILIKVPYSSLTNYLRKKIERYPNWYINNTKEKIIQAIGRTNRHKDDWSKTYLMDSCFKKFMYNNINNNIILERIQNFK